MQFIFKFILLAVALAHGAITVSAVPVPVRVSSVAARSDVYDDFYTREFDDVELVVREPMFLKLPFKNLFTRNPLRQGTDSTLVGGPVYTKRLKNPSTASLGVLDISAKQQSSPQPSHTSQGSVIQQSPHGSQDSLIGGTRPLTLQQSPHGSQDSLIQQSPYGSQDSLIPKGGTRPSTPNRMDKPLPPTPQIATSHTPDPHAHPSDRSASTHIGVVVIDPSSGRGLLRPNGPNANVVQMQINPSSQRKG